MRRIFRNSQRNKTNPRHAFTLVELLVVIAIIGVLVGLIMPAVNSARESGRRAQCASNLHQMALGCTGLEAKYQYFPSGGWGKWWAGSPDVGPGIMQPGGWHYNILPFIDRDDLHELGRNGDKTGGGQRAQNPVPIFLCPTRHHLQAFPFSSSSGQYVNINSPQSVIGRSDYAANAGSNAYDPTKSTGPYTTSTNWATTPGTSILTVASSATACNGVICRAIPVASAQIKDGLSYTYLIGERFMTIPAYNQGPTENDAGWDSGYDYNTVRWTASAPSQDRNIAVSQQLATLFGSSHEAGFNMAFCDGQVKLLSYVIDPTTHMQLGHRSDGQPTQLQNVYGGPP